MTSSRNKIFSATTRKWGLRLLTVVVLMAFSWHFRRLSEQLDWAAFGAALARPGQWKYLFLAVILMPLNWWIEARKWFLLLRAFLPWSFPRTLRATLAGVSLSAATPNRIGEIGGRLLVADRDEWPGVLTSSVLGSACQWVAFLLLAWPALMWTADGLLRERLPFAVVWLWPIGPLLLAAGWWGGKPLLLKLIAWAEKRFGLANTQLKEGLEHVKTGLMLRAGGYACLRFTVYCTQLYLLLWFFGLELPLLEGLAGIAGIYLVQAGIPLPPGVNLVTRTELGLLLWGDSPEAAVATLAAFTTLFAVNVLLPALPGYWLIVKKEKR
ncbi:lysylphosphatidylglycerol synthase domain-containing protein [Neolewinella agarilytica]|uniref:lysylphosphatidylglycerol synthase domain-containing protein n=1 Tax=Neolewinella agarilytica TaxID=478744 RepID=UPI0023576EF9|nr:lysylphosphatidylglycerol synthase domain-containing protein [Neolewinella agarilytica]